jgi:hypothetical protein
MHAFLICLGGWVFPEDPLVDHINRLDKSTLSVFLSKMKVNKQFEISVLIFCFQGDYFASNFFIIQLTIFAQIHLATLFVQDLVNENPAKCHHLMEVNPHLGHAVLAAIMAVGLPLPPQVRRSEFKNELWLLPLYPTVSFLTYFMRDRLSGLKATQPHLLLLLLP